MSDQIVSLREDLKLTIDVLASACDEHLIDAVYDALDVFRSILGDYQVSEDLTETFRLQLEPALRSVWSESDLQQFRATLLGFGRALDQRLAEWQDLTRNPNVDPQTS